MNYKVTRDSSYRGSDKPNKNDLQHWKYIKREKGPNGKWIYYYDDSELQKYEKGVTETVNGVKTTYKKSDDLLDGSSKTTTAGKSEKTIKSVNDDGRSTEYKIPGKSGKTVSETKTQGKLSRAVAKGEKMIFDHLLKNRKKKK